MVTQYPAEIDDSITLPLLVDGVTNVNVEVINRLRNAIVAVEEELGIKPSGLYTTVRARLDALDDLISHLQIIKLAGDLGGTLNSPKVIGLRGVPVSTTTPTSGQILRFNGLSWAPFTLSGSGIFSAGGDLSGNDLSQIVVGLQNRPLASTAPTTGQAVIWNGTQWEPGDATTPPAAPLKSFQFNNSGALGAVPWTYEGEYPGSEYETGNKTVLSETLSQHLITKTVTPGTFLLWQTSEGLLSDSLKTFLTIGSNFAGDLTTMPDYTITWARYIQQNAIGEGNGDAGLGSFSNKSGDSRLHSTGTWAFPNFALINNAGVNFPAYTFGDGYGIFFFQKVDTAPTILPQNGIHLWVDSSTESLKYRRPDASIVLLDGYVGGNLSGTWDNSTVIKINGATVPIAGSLVTGNGLHVTGASTLSYSALNLAGGVNYVTGVLPSANQAAQTMGGDVSGTTTSATVIKVNGATVPVSGSLVTGNGLYVTGSSTLSYSALNLAGGANYVNGILPSANQAAQTMGGDVSGTTTVATVIKVNGITYPSVSLTTGQIPRATGTSAVAYGALDLANTNAITGNLPLNHLTPSSVDGYILSTVSGVPVWIPEEAHFFEISFVAALTTTNNSTFDRIGARKIDMSLYPATIGALSRTVTFIADIQRTTGATSVEVQLFDVTHSVQVTSILYSTDTSLVEQTTSSLTVGSSSGNIRNDVASIYEVSMRMNGGVVGTDAVYCNNARILINYS